MARSIRWRLQIWYAAVLAAVLAGFAGLLYYRARAALYRDVDARLKAAVLRLDADLRVMVDEYGETLEGRPPPRRDGRPPPSKDRGPPPFGPPDRGERPPPPWDEDGPPPDRRPPRRDEKEPSDRRPPRIT